MASNSSPGFADKIKANFLKLCESDHNKKTSDEPTEPNKPVSTSTEPQDNSSNMAHKLTKLQVRTNPNYKKHGTKSYVYMMSKYGFNPTQEGPYSHHKTVHQQGKFAGEHGQKSIGGKARFGNTLVKAASDGTSGQVSSEDIQNDSLYLTPVQIGTPAQTFHLDFDTGSSDLWIWSTELPSSTTSGTSHTIFDASKSSTYKKSTGETWKISYGDGSSASGDVGTDTVSIGNVTIKNQAIELAKSLSSAFQQDTGDGLLGLAWGSINTVTPTAVKTPVENMIAQDDIPSSAELFTAYLGSWRDTADADKGESFYTFGYIDEDTVTTTGQEISYTPVDNSQGFWSVASASYTVGGTTYTQSGNTAIMDTGTTLALVSDEVCKNVYAAIPGSKYDSTQQGYVFPSDTTADNLPVVTMAIGDKQFTIAKEDLGFADAGSGMVYGGIQSRGTMTFDILGDVMLKNIYAIFDVGNVQFGAVQRTEATQNLTAPSSTS